MLGVIKMKIREAAERLRGFGYESKLISPREFYDYMTGETPTGDITTLEDVLANEYLIIHEVVEISELKRMGVPINKRTVVEFHPRVYEAHLTATEYELDYAVRKGDYAWLKNRLDLAKSWLADEYMPKELIPRYMALIRRFSEHLSKHEGV